MFSNYGITHQATAQRGGLVPTDRHRENQVQALQAWPPEAAFQLLTCAFPRWRTGM